MLDDVIASDDAFTLKQLAIGGRDLMERGISEGPQIGTLLRACLDAVIDEEVENDREALIAFALKQA